MTNMKNTTTIQKQATNGLIYHVSQTFQVGDTVLIHNCSNGEVFYSAVICDYFKFANGSHRAVLFNPICNSKYENTLENALVVNSIS